MANVRSLLRGPNLVPRVFPRYTYIGWSTNQPTWQTNNRPANRLDDQWLTNGRPPIEPAISHMTSQLTSRPTDQPAEQLVAILVFGSHLCFFQKPTYKPF